MNDPRSTVRGPLLEFMFKFGGVMKQEVHRPYRSPEYQRLLSEGLIFAYNSPKFNNGIGKQHHQPLIQ